ncbi:helix-turn-helix transcriptional regulator [Sphaerimonospora sp. CA-214678]|uniref:helix-turn-helix transcriptional regulator n=1 Tax=Sphaerimonospora sp. CA-214678 TaxID=3240029 RepID=UPI003D91BED1
MELYGLDREQRIIARRLDDVRGGCNELVLVDGLRGTGKTALLNRISGIALRKGFDVIEGPATRHRKLLLAASIRADGGMFRSFPEMVGVSHAEAGPDPLVEAIEAEFAASGGARGTSRPVLVALDDVSWHHPDVWAALAGLPSAAVPQPVLWVFAGTTVSGLPLHGGAYGAGIVRLTLGPMDRRSALRMAADRLGGPPDAELTRLIDACGHHPGLIAATLDTLISCRACAVRDGVARLTAESPPRQVLTGLLRDDPRLSEHTRALLAAISVRRHEPRMSELLNLPNEIAVPLLGAVREATEAGVLVVDGDRLRFRYALVREAASLLGVCQGGDGERSQGRRQDDDAVLGAAGARMEPSARAHPLSAAEHGIARLVVDGLTNRQIASRVNLSPHTVNFHLRKIFRKLGVSSRVELVGAYLHRPDAADELQAVFPT